jgi:AcrR family transcriptional regulator
MSNPTESKLDAPTAPQGVPVRRKGVQRSSRAKSEQTHQALRRATAQLLDQEPSRELKVTDITRLAKVSPATFYLYFADVNEAVLAVLEDTHRDIPDFPGMVAAFRPETLRADLRAFVMAYVDYWDPYRSTFRVATLSADEGNERFRAARVALLTPLVDALDAKITAFRGATIGADQASARALAFLLVGALGRLVSVAGGQRRDKALTPPKVIDAAIQLLCDSLRPGLE